MPFVPDPIQPNDVKYPGATPSFVPDAVQPTNTHPTIPGATPSFVPDPGQENPLLNHIQNPNTPIDQKQAAISAITSYAKSIGNFALGAAKSLGETALHIGTSQNGNELLRAASEFLPEKVNLPVLGETSIKYSKDPLTMVKQGAEDLLNVLPGGGESQALKNVSKNAWSYLLKQTSKSLEKNPKLAEQAAETGITALTKGGIVKKAKLAIQNLELGLDDLLSNSEGKIDSKAVAEYLNELKNSYSKIPGEQNSVEAIAEIQKQMAAKGDLGVKEANELKRTIYQKISNSYGKGTLEIPAKTEAQRALASGIKQEIEKIIPEVKDLNAKQAVYIQMKKAIERTMRNEEAKGVAGLGIGGYDLLTGGIGTMAGLATGNPLMGAGAVVFKKGVESAGFRTGLSKLAQHFNQLSPTKKLLMYQGLKGLVGETADFVTNKK